MRPIAGPYAIDDPSHNAADEHNGKSNWALNCEEWYRSESTEQAETDNVQRRSAADAFRFKIAFSG